MPQVSRVKIKKIEPIKGSDFLDKHILSNKNTVVWAKGKFKEGETVLYIAEASLLPQDLIKELGLEGRLAGSKKNRVKALKLRKVYSEGLIMKDTIKNSEGEPLEDEYLDRGLKIRKYIPKVPTSLSGAVFNLGTEHVGNFEVRKDYENIYEDALVVSVTEKLHGTNIRIGKVDFSHDDLFGEKNNIYVCSKGLGNKGQVFKNSVDNAYTKMFKKYQKAFEALNPGEYVVAEVYGSGIQDLHYGLEEPDLAVINYPGHHNTKEERNKLTEEHGLRFVPLLYSNSLTIEEFFNIDLENMNTQAGAEGIHQMAEGIVAHVNNFGLVKRVAQRYKLRKGGSEYN